MPCDSPVTSVKDANWRLKESERRQREGVLSATTLTLNTKPPAGAGTSLAQQGEMPKTASPPSSKGNMLIANLKVFVYLVCFIFPKNKY